MMKFVTWILALRIYKLFLSRVFVIYACVLWISWTTFAWLVKIDI